MRIRILTFLLSVLCVSAFAQNEGLSYQATVRNSSGALMANQNVSLRFSIMSGSATGTTVYSETQTATTTSLGLINTTIGTGTAVTGNWNTMNWNNGNLWLKVEADVTGGTNYADLGTSLMSSVAFSKQSGGVTLYASGSGTNNSKMVVSQSGVNAGTGLRFNDSLGKFEFTSNGNANTTVELNTGNVSTGGSLSAGGNLAAGGTINATGTVSSNNHVTAANNVSAGGNVTAGGNITATGNVTGNNIIVNGEINKSATGSANLLPIAYGTISSTGTILSSSGNVSVTKSATGVYTITITGENYYYGSYTTIATAVGTAANIVTSSGSNNLLVYTSTVAGIAADAIFQFVVYKN